MGSVGHATRKVLRATMTRELGAKLNWAAQRGTKTGICGYRHIVFGIAGDLWFDNIGCLRRVCHESFSVTCIYLLP